MIEFIQPKMDDLVAISQNMREIDRRECAILAEKSPLETMVGGVGHSIWSLVMRADETPIACFGIAAAALLGDVGRPWLLATEDFGGKNARAIIANTKPMIASMHNHFSVLSNYVHEENVRAIRWLKWGGFHLADQFTIKGQVFHEFRSEVDRRMLWPALNDWSENRARAC